MEKSQPINIPFDGEQTEQENDIDDKKMINKSVEVNILPDENQTHDSKIFVCNRYIFNTHSEAETQVFIPEAPRKIISLKKKTNDKK